MSSKSNSVFLDQARATMRNLGSARPESNEARAARMLRTAREVRSAFDAWQKANPRASALEQRAAHANLIVAIERTHAPR